MPRTDELLKALNRIHPVDCVAGMNGLPAGEVDLAFADPPFNIGYDYDVYDDSRDCGQYLDWSRRWITAVHRVLKPSGTFWLAIGDEYAAELKVLSQDIGFHCRSWVVWYYTFGVNCTRKFSRSHVHLFHFVKDRNAFTFRCDELENRIPSARQLVYADNRANPRGRLPDDTWILRPQDLCDRFTPAEDTWYFPRVAGTFKQRAGFHGCQMPEQLLGRIIRLCSHENDVVLDPFSGSATTLVVAKKLGRQTIGFEISPEYVRRGADRLDQARRGDDLEGDPEPTVSAPPTRGRRDKDDQGPNIAIGTGVRPRTRPRAENPDPVESTATTPQVVALFRRGLVEAFRRSNDGYSPDRVVTDPELDQRFVEECRTLGLPGDARTWNWALLNCRKAGLLAEITTDRRTQIGWHDCDSYLFASEIAAALLMEQGCESLEHILCDPMLAFKFDRIAGDFAPGHSSFEYRWAAIKLRKEAKSARSRAEVLKPARLGNPIPVAELAVQSIASEPGLFLVSNQRDHAKFYAGEALNLRERLELQFGEGQRETWFRYCDTQDLRVEVAWDMPGFPELLAYQSSLVKAHRPRMNVKEPAGAE
jgi:DNA modification methylase